MPILPFLPIEFAPPPIPPEERPALEYIRQWILRYTGLCPQNDKPELLYQKLKTLSWRLKLSGVSEMAEHLRLNDQPHLAAELAEAVSVNHTFFFREPEVLGLFQEQVLPQLPSGETWRIWSAAAASGEEVYTLAILLAEHLSLPLAPTRASILGTDLNWQAIKQAEHGVYPEQRLQLVSPTLRRRYFDQLKNDHWQVKPALRQLCLFRQMNLKSRLWPFQNPFHVIFCRNVLYYFDREHQAALLERMYSVAAPGGWLVTSVTENVDELRVRWQKLGPGLYRKS